MKTLLLLRHAKSSWKSPGTRDHDRPLNERGKNDAPRLGRLLEELGLVPDLILTSTARRARKTAEKVAQNCSYDGDPQEAGELYLAAPHDLVRVVQAVDDDVDRLLLVGHNPGLETFVQQLTGRHEELPTATLVRITLPLESWAELNAHTTGELVDVWRPRELD